jgi:hypothetical protein
MKMTIIRVLAFSSITATSALGLDFDMESVKSFEEQISNSLATNQTRIDWTDSQDPLVKQQKFSSLINEIAGGILARQWVYTGGGSWPLIDWSKVNTLKSLIDEQTKVFEETHIVAQSDEEMAKLSTVAWLAGTMGKDAEPWFEDWLLVLAKSSNENLKRLLFFTISNYGEDMLKGSDTLRAIDWNKWEAAFNQSDNLGKALLLICMTDLASRSEDYVKVATIHIGALNGTNDDLKAIALYTGIRKLGPAVVIKWQDIADNHPNPKMKILAQELINQ